ncbi:MAG: rod shape-determining protein MreD [Anaerolineae bacterium]|nr:rod shape-determining protein MreD [Anaerolineae bacterium]
MSTLIPFVILISAALAQTTLAPYLKISGVHPDLVFVLVIGWITLRGLEEGFFWALIGGLSLDFLSGAPFGLFTLTMLLVALVTNLFHGRLFGSSIVLPLGLTFPLSLLFNGLALLFLTLLGRHIMWDVAFFSKLLPVSIFNTMVMMLAFPLLYLLNRFLTPRQLSF